MTEEGNKGKVKDLAEIRSNLSKKKKGQINFPGQTPERLRNCRHKLHFNAERRQGPKIGMV